MNRWGKEYKGEAGYATPPQPQSIPVLTAEGMTRTSGLRVKATCCAKSSPNLGPPPDKRVSREGPSSTSRIGEAEERGLAGRPEVLAVEDQELMLTHIPTSPAPAMEQAGLRPPPPNSHTHTPPRGAARLRRF